MGIGGCVAQMRAVRGDRQSPPATGSTVAPMGDMGPVRGPGSAAFDMRGPHCPAGWPFGRCGLLEDELFQALYAGGEIKYSSNLGMYKSGKMTTKFGRLGRMRKLFTRMLISRPDARNRNYREICCKHLRQQSAASAMSGPVSPAEAGFAGRCPLHRAPAGQSGKNAQLPPQAVRIGRREQPIDGLVFALPERQRRRQQPAPRYC